MLFNIFGGKKLTLPSKEDAFPGRAEAIPLPAKHFVNGHSFAPSYPAQMEKAMFGLGCFWGAEREYSIKAYRHRSGKHGLPDLSHFTTGAITRDACSRW